MFWPRDSVSTSFLFSWILLNKKKINYIICSIVLCSWTYTYMYYYIISIISAASKVEKNDLFDFTQSMIRSFDMDTPLYLYLIWTSEKEIYRKRKNAQNTDSLRPLKSSKIESGAYNHM